MKTRHPQEGRQPTSFPVHAEPPKSLAPFSPHQEGVVEKVVIGKRKQPSRSIDCLSSTNQSTNKFFKDELKRQDNSHVSPVSPPLSPLFSSSDEEEDELSGSAELPGSVSRVRIAMPISTLPPINAISTRRNRSQDSETEVKKSQRVPKRKRKRHTSPSPISASPLPSSIVEDIEDLPSSSSSLSDGQVTTKELLYALQLLSAHFNWTPPPTPSSKTVLDSLIRTILSQATTDSNSGRAFQKLKSRYPNWQSCLHDSFDNLQDTIRIAGLSESKTTTIRNMLQTVHDERNGDVSMEYVKDIGDGEEVRKELTRFKGVGEKTAACVLLFGMGRVAFPVDTHVRRVVERLGWMGKGKKKWTAQDVWKGLREKVPEEWDVALGLHVLIIQVGKKICKAGKQAPKCDKCPLKTVCETGKRNVGD